MSVTAADLERAQSVLGWGGLSEDYLRADELTQRNAIAAALAEEREKARAPFLALADDLVGNAATMDELRAERVAAEPENPSVAYADAVGRNIAKEWRKIADHIRRAAEES